MMRRLLLGSTVFLVAASASTSAAQATEVVRPDGGDVGWYEAQIARAQVPGPSSTIELSVDSRSCGDVSACAFNGSQPRIYFDPARSVPQHHAWLHEVGHVFDYTVMREGDRKYFRRVLHDPRPWRSPPNSPHEKFAEAYAFCAADRLEPRLEHGFGYRYKPTRNQHRRICRMIRRAGDWR